MNWNYHNPTQIHFGLKWPEDFKVSSAPTLFVTSSGSTKRGITEQVRNIVHGVKVFDQVSNNPSFDDLRKLVLKLDFKPHQIIAIGGGSVMDMGKILSYVLASSDSIDEILNDLVNGNKLKSVHPIPFIAIPTTSGTGSEVTPSSTIWDMENKKKYSIVTTNLHPQKALLFPELTLSLPWDITLSTGLDAFSQCLESIWNKNATQLNIAIAQKGIGLILKALPILKKEPKNLLAREDMLTASLFSGLCISNTRTAMAHAISYPLTAHYGTPHGIACSFTLADLWDFNLKADDGRLKDLAFGLGSSPEQFSKKILEFFKDLDFKNEFKKTITSTDQVLKLSSEMFTPGRADNNLNAFSDDTLKSFVEKATLRWL